MLRGRESDPACEIMSLTCTVHYPALFLPLLQARTVPHYTQQTLNSQNTIIAGIIERQQVRVAQLVRAWDS